MGTILLHYYNARTGQEYLVITHEDIDRSDYKEEGFDLQNECLLINADISLPINTIFTKE